MNVPPRALVIGASETAQLLHLPVLVKLRDMHRLELVEICDLQLSKAVAARYRFGLVRLSIRHQGQESTWPNDYRGIIAWQIVAAFNQKRSSAPCGSKAPRVRPWKELFGSAGIPAIV
jgi:hypothetical protein